jgi:hypothetical protein
MGHDATGAWALEVHATTNGQLAYYLGAPGDLGGVSDLDSRGFRPRVAADLDTATVVEVHQSEPEFGAMWSRTGRVTSRDGRREVSWAPASPYGTGQWPAIASSRGQLVEVDMADTAGEALVYRTGTIAGGGIAWQPERPIGGGGYHPALAIAGDDDGKGALVVEAHQAGTGFGPMSMRVGRIDPTGVLTWRDAHEYDAGTFPAVALARTTVVEVHQGQDGNGSLWMKIGDVNPDGTVTWKPAREYDSGGHPVIAVDAAAGRGIEGHEGGAGFGPLWGHDLDVY